MKPTTTSSRRKKTFWLGLSAVLVAGIIAGYLLTRQKRQAWGEPR